MSTEQQDRTSLVTFLLVLLGVGALALRMVAPYLIAVTMGGILAMLSRPAYQFLLRKKPVPKLAAAVVTLTLVLLVIAPLLAFTASAIKQGAAFAKWMSDAPGLSIPEIVQKLSHWGPMELIASNAGDVETQLREWAQSAGAATTGFLLELAKSLPNAGLQLFLACLACFFFLIDGRRLYIWVYGKIPLEPDIRVKLTASFKDTAISTIWASMAAAATQAGVMGVSFLVLGIPAATLAGWATFIFAWIPILGSTPVWISGAVYLYTQGSPGKAIALVGAGLGTGVIDNLMRPLILRGRGEMHPLVSLVAIFGGIQLFGIVGVFLGPIIIAIVITLLQVWPIVGRRSGLM